MALFDEDLPQEPVAREDLSYGTPATDAELLLLNYRKGQLSANVDADYNATQAAREERNAAIEKATGKPFKEAVAPYVAGVQKNAFGPVAADGSIDFRRMPSPEDMAADAMIAELQAGGTGVGILTTTELRARARELAMQAVVDAQDADARDRTGVSGTLARFVGDAGNSMNDRAVMMLLPLGLATDGLAWAPFLAAEGALGGAGSAASLPAIAKWQKEIGLPEMTTGDMANQVAFDAAISAGTAGLLRGAGHAFSRMVTPRQAVDAYNRAFPNGEGATPELQARRDILEHMADMADDNPLGDTPAQEAEHFKRLGDVMDALDQDKPLPTFPEDATLPVDAPVAVPERAPGDAVAGVPETIPADPVAPDDIPIDDVPVIEVKKRKWTQKRPQTLQEFMAGEGGLRDDGGELKARGITTRNSMTQNGPWYRRAGDEVGGGLLGGTKSRQGKGLAPDEMRRRLVEAGYLRDTAFEGGNAVTTADDLFQLIDEAMGGRRVVSESDMGWQAELDATTKAREENDIALEPFRAEFGRNAYIAVRHGEDFARDALKARKAGVKWTDEDLQWAAEFSEKYGESPRVALDEAIHQRWLRQRQAAIDADLAPPPDFDDAVNSLPVGTDDTGKIITFGELAQSGQNLPAGSRAGDGPGSQGDAPGERRAGGSNGAAPADGNPADDIAPSPSPVTADDVTDLLEQPDVNTARVLFDSVPEPDDVTAVLKEIADMEAELKARFDDGAELDVSEIEPGFASAKDLMDDLDADAEFLAAVKVCLE